MKVAVYSAKRHDITYLTPAVGSRHELVFLDTHLDRRTAGLAIGCDVASLFVSDDGSQSALEALSEVGVRFLALRSTGYNHVDLDTARRLGLRVARVPGYSPYAVAEHTIGLILALDRKIHRAYARVREGNFSLDGLLGFDLHGRTVGVVGTGTIGAVVCRILAGFGCRVLAHDRVENPVCLELGVEYVDLEQLLTESDVITLHCPLTPATHHLIGAAALSRVKRGVMLVNTSRGGLVDTAAVVEALKDGTVGYLGLDVYEEEADLFFEDQSEAVIQDDVFSRLLTFPNVLVTGHQAFFTADALEQIARVTAANLDGWAAGMALPTEL